MNTDQIIDLSKDAREKFNDYIKSGDRYAEAAWEIAEDRLAEALGEYEAKRLEQVESQVKGTVRATGHYPLSDVRESFGRAVGPLIRTPIQEKGDNGRAGVIGCSIALCSSMPPDA